MKEILKELNDIDEDIRNFYPDTEYVVGKESMKCGSYEAEKRKYKKYIGKSGKIWLVADQPNCADNIYVEGGKNSDGFGGRILTFETVDGEELKLKGPWGSNSDSFYKDTSIDIRDKHLIFVVISKERGLTKNPYKLIMKNLVYKDEEPTIGYFNRGKEILKKYQNRLKCDLYMYSKSTGGSCWGLEKYKGE